MKNHGWSRTTVVFLTMVGMFVASQPAGATVLTNVFNARQNVNVLNSYAATVTPLQQTIFPGLDASNLRSAWMEGSFWDGGASPAGGTNSLTMNFGTTRNLKTINLSQFPGSEATAFTVETSPNGTTWTSQPATYTPSANTGQIVLGSAVDAQYLRVTATAINDGNGADRWVVTGLRVLGDTGSFEDTARTIDRVSGTGQPTFGGVTLTRNGSVSETDTTDSEFVNDALSPIKRQVLFNMGAGDGFTLFFSGAPVQFERVGLFFDPAHMNASDAFTIETSANNMDWVNALTQAGGLAQGLNYFTLTSTNIGEYLRFTYTSTSSGDTRIGDIQVFGFQSIPEPSMILLFGVGGTLIWRLRRRRSV